MGGFHVSIRGTEFVDHFYAAVQATAEREFSKNFDFPRIGGRIRGTVLRTSSPPFAFSFHDPLYEFYIRQSISCEYSCDLCGRLIPLLGYVSL
jgi:hypothetical protein